MNEHSDGASSPIRRDCAGKLRAVQVSDHYQAIFTWGYYGWGNATPQLVKAVDTVEASRGFETPIFVDIRIRRTVRAKGFQGNAFEKVDS